MRRRAVALLLASSLVAACKGGARGRHQRGHTAVADDGVALAGDAATDDDVAADDASDTVAAADEAAGDDEPVVPVSAAEWAAVEAAAAPVLAAGPPDELARALVLIERVTAPTVRPDDLVEAEHLRQELPADARRAVAALVRWAGAHGRLPAIDCVKLDAEAATDKAIAHLVQAALVVAGDDPDAPELRAVLYLAGRMRAEGPTLLEGVLGGRFAESVRAWVVARGARQVPAARGYQPAEEDLLRLAAAEAVCALAIMKDPGVDPLTGGAPDPDALARLLATDGPLVRRYWVDLLADLRARPRDPGASDRRIAARDEKLDADQSLLAMAVGQKSRYLGKLRGFDERYRLWLGGLPAEQP